jgi:hypothetical protein
VDEITNLFVLHTKALPFGTMRKQSLGTSLCHTLKQHPPDPNPRTHVCTWHMHTKRKYNSDARIVCMIL